MLEGFVVVFLLLAVIVVAAITVIVGLALVRRPAPDWQRHLRAQGQAISKEPVGDQVTAQETTLGDLLDANRVPKNGYFDPDRLPGIERIESVAERIENIQEKRRCEKES